MSDTSNVTPGGWQAPSPELKQQIDALSPEARSANATYLRDRYPNQRAEIDQAYGQTAAAPLTQADRFDAMWAKADASGADIDLSVATRALTQDGHAPADVAAFAADLKQGLAATGLHPAIASAIGEGMISAAREASDNAETVDARWVSHERPTIERIARMPDGSPASWDQIKAGVQKALENVPAELRDEIIRSGAISSASVVLNLFMHGQRLIAREAMTPKGK